MTKVVWTSSRGGAKTRCPGLISLTTPPSLLRSEFYFSAGCPVLLYILHTLYLIISITYNVCIIYSTGHPTLVCTLSSVLRNDNCRLVYYLLLVCNTNTTSVLSVTCFEVITEFRLHFEGDIVAPFEE